MQPDGLAAEGEAAEGPTFSLPIKVLASVLVGSIVLSGLRVAGQIYGASWSASAICFLVTAAGVTAVCYYRMLRSHTTIDAEFVQQDFFWRKEVALADITQAKFIYVPYMTWLIAPRLVVRARSRGFFVFYAGNKNVLQAFARLSLRA